MSKKESWHKKDESKRRFYNRHRSRSNEVSNVSEAGPSCSWGSRRGRTHRRRQKHDWRKQTTSNNQDKSSTKTMSAATGNDKMESKGTSAVNTRKRSFGTSHRSGSPQTKKKDQGKAVESDSTTGHDTQSTSSDNGDVLDIPGFYYDKEKKRYFKIAPNHCKNAVTQEKIAKKKAEVKRQQDIQSIFHEPKQKPKVHVEHSFSNIVPLLQSRSVGCLNETQLTSSVVKTRVCNLKPLDSQYLFDSENLGMYENLEHMQIMKVTPEHDELLGLWCLKDTWVQRIQLLKLSEGVRNSEPKSLHLTAVPHHKVIIQSLNKVTDMCWAPMSGETNKRHILYTSICHTGYLYSLAMIRSLTAEEESQSTFIDYNLGKKATWSCAWNQLKQQFSVGSERSALLLDIQTRRMWEYSTNNSDPLTQTFSNQTSHMLHTGTRKGEILTHDTRSKTTRPVSCLQHRSSVCGLHLLSDDNSLVAGDFTGRVCLWDLRQRKVVMEYRGGYNQYTKIPVHVNEQENIVYGAGQDGYTKIWCLRQGTLLRTIPPPCAVTRETIPVVQFSMRWANRPGNAGLVMGLQNKLHLYGGLTS